MSKTYDIELMPLFEQFANQTLIIVDVQTPYKKFWVKNGKPNLENDIAKYANSFMTVYQIYDTNINKETNRENVQTYNFPNQTKCFAKKYGGTHDQMVTGLHFDVDRYILKVDDGGTHDWFFPSADLVDTLKAIQTPIVLVGGAYGECLYDIEYLLKCLGKQYTVNKNLTYHA